MASIGLIGLGNAGRPMAERILAKGHSLTVFDIDTGALDRVVQRGARPAHSAGAAVSDITITLLPSSLEVRQAVLGANGVLSALRPASMVIDLSGTDPDCARELEERSREKQATFIGGTIHASGAPAVVIPQGRFSIVIGGEKAKTAAAAAFLNEVAQTVICLPEPWMPKAFKIAIILYATVNNIITAEIGSWLTAQGADPKLFLKLLQTTGSQASAIRMEEFMKRKNNHCGALSNSYKDFRQALSIAAKLGIPMPLASMANQIQEMGRASGFARLNSPAAIGELYELLTGADLSGATMDAEKKLRQEREPRVIYLAE
jgi:3-hydroxyisobutyrate dehydrogenase-like beta-hydroxyacid dehydrogenase